MDIAYILSESLCGFFMDEFDEYNLEEITDKIARDEEFLERLKAEMLNVIDNCETIEIDMRD